MIDDQPPPQSDLWSDWLLHVRHGGDPEYLRKLRERLEYYADRVIDGAGPAEGKTLADIGAGEGLIAFRAIERIGPSLRAILTDVSIPMLRHAEAIAVERGVLDQCVFYNCSADNLDAVESGSVDIVTTRAVLAYVADKRAAFREFSRVMKPGGRISLAEPILFDEALSVSALRRVVETLPNGHILRLIHRWRAAQFPDSLEKITSSSIVNFTERDLVEFAKTVGFTEIHLEFHIDVRPFSMTSWDVIFATSPHPLAKPLGALLDEQFSPEERKVLIEALRHEIAGPNAVATERIAYLTAIKPLR